MPSSLALLLTELFPTLSTRPLVEPDCWVTKAVRLDPPELQTLSDAIDMVERHDELSTLKQRILQEHPTRVQHQENDDFRLLDCLTETIAFTWAASWVRGSPSFTTSLRGTPDIYIDTGFPESNTWIEAKAIHASEGDRQRTKLMLKTNEPLLGGFERAGSGLWNKFESDFYDAKAKFDRQSKGNRILFFNLTMLDMAAWKTQQDEFEQANKLAHDLEQRESSIKIVIVYSYHWMEPIRDLR